MKQISVSGSAGQYKTLTPSGRTTICVGGNDSEGFPGSDCTTVAREALSVCERRGLLRPLLNTLIVCWVLNNRWSLDLGEIAGGRSAASTN